MGLGWGLNLGHILVWGLKLHLRLDLSKGLYLGLGCMRLKLNSDLRVDLGLCFGLEMRLSLNVWHLLDLTKGLDLNLGTDLGLGLGL